MASNPNKKIAQALPWAAVEAALAAAAGVATTLIVARLVGPSEFGRAAVAISIVALVEILSLFGLSDALIKSKSFHTSLIDTAFWLMVSFGVTGFILCLVLANPIAGLYKDSGLAALIMVQGLSCIFAALMGVPTARLMRKMRARGLAKRTLAGALTAFTTSYIMAANNFGAWSLIVGFLAGRALQCTVLWIGQPRLPRLQFSRQEIWPLLTFGWGISAEAMLWSATGRLFPLLFGYLHGVTALGYFNFALRLVEDVANLLSMMSSRFALSFFSALQRSGQSIGDAFLRASRLVTLISTPIFAGIAATASVFIPLFFGNKWDQSIPIVQILCVTWIVLFSRILAPSMLRVKDAQANLVGVAFLSFITTISAVWLTANQSLLIAACAFSSRLLVTFPTSVVLVSTRGEVRWTKQMSIITMPLLSAALMAGVIFAITKTFNFASQFAHLMILIFAGMVIYTVSICLFDKESLKEVKGLIKKTIRLLPNKD